ncbi:OLC1v1028005C1 [Oldenlandia corymbosa var. corymbosa]|uniref:OLC1v1028005C1 n=1 Tax=Oldenlandia corymbosa var. corymbosa TaxID=529605 RepID=A0AAV1CAQ0_OLDCO|nr:OLC1v1028005C1 [Oldenlandia corymbosa var. corymbosa]
MATASATAILSPTTTTGPAAASTFHPSLHIITKFPFSKPTSKPLVSRPITRLHVSSSNPTAATSASGVGTSTKGGQETIFYDGGAHYGDLVANLLLGFTLFWLPLTLAAVLRGFFLRYRFTNLRVTVISGLTGQERSDFSYKVIKDVQVVPRFIGEWGDIIITLKDGTKVDLRSVPKFREIAKYCLSMADQPVVLKESGPKGF